MEILRVVEENHVSNIPIVDQDKILVSLITKSSLVTTQSTVFEYEA